jgi:hypothetical protein
MSLGKRDKRAILLTAVFAIGLLSYQYVFAPWLTHWEGLRADTLRQEARLAKVDHTAAAKTAALRKAVPALQIPEREVTQRLRFEKAIHERFKAAGILPERLRFLGSGAHDASSPYTKLRLQATCSCSLEQALKFLASLPEVSTLTGIEEFDLTIDERNRQKAELTITFATYAR